MGGDQRGRPEGRGGDREDVRKWVRQAEIDAGHRPGRTSEESAELRLRRENAELRRANEILKAASAFFASARPALDTHS
jgi:transposase